MSGNFFGIFSNLYDEGILKKLDFLKGIRLFEGIKKKNLIHILECLQERTYLKGEIIFNQGDIGRALFIVFSGKIALARSEEAPKSGPPPSAAAAGEIIAEVRPGEFFGEMALLEEMPRTATAYALEETRVFMLFKIKLENLLFARPAIGVVIASQLAKILSARLRTYIEK